ncbi:MAG: site-specific integrase, partial [Armatimonadota bacterium]|nr:site-specific integrase [Armatimonadota bacterium]
RRSEVVGLDRLDVSMTGAGLVVTLRRSKTDQMGVGREIGIPLQPDAECCPVRALKNWLKVCGAKEGPVFVGVDRHGNMGGRLSGQAVALIIKRAALSAGLDPAAYAGHSLRSGFATSAAESGASERAIMDQTGHKSTLMVRKYIRRGSIFRDNACNVIRM